MVDSKAATRWIPKLLPKLCLDLAESTEAPSALMDSVLLGHNGTEVDEVGLHRCHVVGASEGWDATLVEGTTPL